MINKEKNFISAVIYVHNAEERIEGFLLSIINALEDNFEHSEIICVNDYSTDNSLKVIQEVGEKAKATTVSVINMSYFHGLELSMNAGVDLAIGDFVFEFDNTFFDFDIQVIMDVYRKSLEGFDIVSASPNKKEKLTSRMFYRMFDKYSDSERRMNTESFRILSRRVINRINSLSKNIPYRKAMYSNCGLKTANIKYEASKFIGSMDSVEKKYRSALAIDTLILFTDIGYSFSKKMSVLMILTTIFVAIYSVVAFFASNPVAGWTSTILFLSFAFFGLFVIMTIVIKYLQIILNLVFRRKFYSFESIEKLTK